MRSSSSHRPFRRLGAVLATAGLVVSACGGSDDSEPAAEPAAESASEPASEPAEEPAEDDTLVCRCEEVSAARVRAAVRWGCHDPNRLKGLTRCGMGPCQGRFCGATMEQVFAFETGAARQRIGHFSARPPVKPVTLGQLAGNDNEQINRGVTP